jgi:hypothetical protein
MSLSRSERFQRISLSDHLRHLFAASIHSHPLANNGVVGSYLFKAGKTNRHIAVERPRFAKNCLGRLTECLEFFW